MADEFEKRMREKAEALLLASAEVEPAPLTPAEIKRRQRTSAKLWRTRQRNARKRRKANKKKQPHRREKMQGVLLAERLLARTEPGTWYYFRQLRELLPETTVNGFKAILFQKLPDLGWIERKPIVDNPQASWLNHTGPKGEKAANGMYAATAASTAPKYLYRIGAQQATERASARERLEKLYGCGLGLERASAALCDGFEDL